MTFSANRQNKTVVEELMKSEHSSLFHQYLVVLQEEVRKETRYLEGCFKSPYAWVFPEMMPDNIGWATWRGIFPKKLRRALVIHLAGTGDHSFFRWIFTFWQSHLLIKQIIVSSLENLLSIFK